VNAEVPAVNIINLSVLFAVVVICPTENTPPDVFVGVITGVGPTTLTLLLLILKIVLEVALLVNVKLPPEVIAPPPEEALIRLINILLVANT
jgi:hypothetical protein